MCKSLFRIHDTCVHTSKTTQLTTNTITTITTTTTTIIIITITSRFRFVVSFALALCGPSIIGTDECQTRYDLRDYREVMSKILFDCIINIILCDDRQKYLLRKYFQQKMFVRKKCHFCRKKKYNINLLPTLV